MNINDFIAIVQKCKIQLKGDITEDTTIQSLGIDSLDLSQIIYELEEIVGDDLEVLPQQTIGDILAYINSNIKNKASM